MIKGVVEFFRTASENEDGKEMLWLMAIIATSVVMLLGSVFYQA